MFINFLETNVKCLLALNSEPYHDIRYNLMAVVADRMITCEEKLKQLNGERWITCKINYLFIYCIWVGYFVCLLFNSGATHGQSEPYSYNEQTSAHLSVHTTGEPMWNVTLSSLGGNMQPDSAHPCWSQLTAFKTG